MSKEDLLQCYNKGCGKQYAVDKNNAEACCFHPGEPFFHDAYKGWSCCKRKCTDFTEFLNMKGCTVSFHNNEKPAEVKKPEPVNVEEVVVVRAPEPKKNREMIRPSVDLPLTRLPVVVTPSLKKALETSEQQSNSFTVDKESNIIAVGTQCKNGGCKKCFEGEQSNVETCIYHPGVPIFHEGLKYWSCCKKKTTDFTSFLDQIGCSNGTHLWLKPQDNDEKLNCRSDWHQTASHVEISVFAKNVFHGKSFVEANPVKLKLYLVFIDGIYEEEMELRGIIDVNKSQVTMAATKVEIKLKKAEPLSWDKLYNPKLEITQAIETKDEKLDAVEHINDVNLDDVELVNNNMIDVLQENLDDIDLLE